MKQIIVASFILLLLVPETMFPQAIRRLGLKTGAVIAEQRWGSPSGPDFPTSSRSGVAVGAYIEWLQIPVLSISTEFQYLQKGVTFVPGSPTDGPVYYSVSPQLDYLSIPVLAKLRYDSKSASAYILIGPRFDFLLTSKDYSGFGYIFDHLETSEIGGTVGLGLDFSLVDPVLLGIELRYSTSFEDTFSAFYRTIRNRSLEILLTLSI